MLTPILSVSAHPGPPLMAAFLIPGPRALPCEHEPVPAEYVDLPRSGRVFRASRRVHLGDVDATGTVRLEALARFLQDVATDDADDAQLSDARGVWVLRSSDLEIVTTPVYHEVVELATFCSGTGPRWAERRTRIVGDRGAFVDAAALWVFVDREHGRPIALDDDFHDRYGESAAGRRVRGRLVHEAPPDGASWRSWPLRTSDFDVLDHVNNARSLEAVEDELVRRLPGRLPRRCRIEYRGTLERGDDVVVTSAVAQVGDDDVLAVWLVVDDDVRVSATVTVAGPGHIR
jgi:acyl-ACP thioesterase